MFRSVTPIEAEEREAAAGGYKNDGYSSSVVTRKMISVHGMSENEAEELVGRIFQKKVSARTGDTTVDIAAGIGTAVAAAITLGLMWWYIPDTPTSLLLIYGLLVGVIGRGVAKAIIAMVNANAREDLVKRDD